jgi:hypothetical protein
MSRHLYVTTIEPVDRFITNFGKGVFNLTDFSPSNFRLTRAYLFKYLPSEENILRIEVSQKIWHTSFVKYIALFAEFNILEVMKQKGTMHQVVTRSIDLVNKNL